MRALRCLLALVLLLPLAAPARCPRPCTCPQLAELHCTFRSLLSVPGGLPVELRRVNLGFNRLRRITDGSVAGLKQLELLMLHGNNIHSLSDGAFRDLGALQMLKMSYNELQELRRNTLRGLRSLARLHLDHNQLEFIHPQAFQGLTSLKLLQLEANRLQQLHPDTFSTFTVRGLLHISTLRHLYLSENGLRSLPARLLETMPQLENLYLHGNLWSCDCNMRWIKDWKAAFSGVLKCKTVPPGRHLCPVCSSPKHLHGTKLHTVENLVCSIPVITSNPTEAPPLVANTELLSLEDFREPVGNAFLELQDEHGTQVDLECSVGQPRDLSETTWEHVSRQHLAVNITFSVDLECPVGTDKYEHLWRLIAFYSRDPAHLDRGAVVKGGVPPAYAYTQNPAKDAPHYTGLRVSMAARPAWLMQPSLDLQLDRAQSSHDTVRLVLKTRLSETLELLLHRQRPWVLIQSTNTSQEVHSAVLGSATQITCSTHGSEPAVVQWMLPDRSTLKAPAGGSDRRVSVTQDGRLLIGAVMHADAGAYYCIAEVHGDYAVRPFYLTVLESSGAPPVGDGPVVSIETFMDRPISLDCSASGSPDPEVRWILPDNSIVSVQTNSSRAQVFSNGTLAVQKVQPSDAGYYRCVAANNYGADTADSKVIVLKRKGTTRPSRRFLTGPPPAAEVSTRVEVLAEEAEEASGGAEASQMEIPKNRLHVVKRISAEALIPGRKRRPYRRNQSARKPSGPKDQRVLLDRRTTNVSKNRIDPGKWADLLAKIRDRNKMTSLPVQNQSESSTSPNETVPISVLKQQPETTKHQSPDRPVTPYPSTDPPPSTAALHVPVQPSMRSRTWTPQFTAGGGTLHPHITTAPFHAPTPQWSNTTPPKCRTPFPPKPTPDTSNPDPSDSSLGNQRVIGTRSQVPDLPPSECIHTAAPPTPTRQSRTRPRKPGFRTGNGRRRKRPNRRKPTAGAHVKAPPTSRTAAPTVTEQSEAAPTAVPFTDSQTASFSEVNRDPGPIPSSSFEMDSPLLTTPPLQPASPGSPDHNAAVTSWLSGRVQVVTASSPQSSSLLPEEPLSVDPLLLPDRSMGGSLVTAEDGQKNQSEQVERPITVASVAPPFGAVGGASNDASERTAPSAGSANTSAAALERSMETPATAARSRPDPVTPSRTTSNYTAPTLPPTRDGLTPAQLKPPQSGLSKARVGQRAGPAPGGKPRIPPDRFQTVSVKAETDAQLPCEGPAGRFLSWTTAATGQRFTQSSREQRFEVHPNGTLIIRKTQMTDSGQYFCSGQNQHGLNDTVVNLVVQPLLVTPPLHRDVTVHFGGTVDLECSVEERPLVTWILPSHTHLSAGSEASQRRVAVHSNGTLRIRQVDLSDTGRYRCVTEDGLDTLPVHLQVLAEPPVIQQVQHENQILAEGSSTLIHCTATGVPQPVIHWITPDGVRLTASQLLTRPNLLIFPNGTIHLPKVDPQSSGTYECCASNALASSWRTVVVSVTRNRVLAKATITASTPVRTELAYGSQLLLDCVAAGHPEPRILWRTPSKKLVDTQYSFDPRFRVFPNGTITVQSVTDRDAGDYLCVARNKMGDDYVQLRVNVLMRPAKIEQEQHRSQQEVVYGGDLMVDCVASGLPHPTVRWALPDGAIVNLGLTKDGARLGRSRRYEVFENGTLYFNHVGPSEEGDYTCYAENRLGRDEMKVRVRVTSGASPPQIQDKGTATARVFHGETATLGCLAKGDPGPTITWLSPSSRVIRPVQEKYRLMADGSLVVRDVQSSDEGNYTCKASSSAGQDHKVTKLEVLATPLVIGGVGRAADFIKVTAVEDQAQVVDCAPFGIPAAHVLWILPGNVVLPAPYHSERRTVHPNGTLEMRSLQKADSGQLVCFARNDGGEIRTVFNLDVREATGMAPPNKAESLLLTMGTTMSLNCSFDTLIAPRLTWILPDGTLLVRGDHFFKFLHQHDGSLVISNPSTAESGTYRCLGQSSAGLMERQVTLSTRKQPEIPTRNASPVSILAGETLLLHCQTPGGALRLAWTLPSGVMLNRLQRAGRYAVLPNGTLAIQQVSVHDRGRYVCRGSNDGGSSLLSMSVSVIGHAPRITSAPPSVTHAKQGVAVQLNCAATGMPNMEVAWETPDKMRLTVSAQPRLFGNKYLHPEGSLIIQSPTLRDSGVYRCTARNHLGSDSRATFLNVF